MAVQRVPILSWPMFTDENGEPISADTATIDNHDMLTGSNELGEAPGDPAYTCQDWTSADGDANSWPSVGHAWPRSTRFTGRHWISSHPAGGCGRGIDTRKIPSNLTKTVGSGGGYGGFYCFAVSE